MKKKRREEKLMLVLEFRSMLCFRHILRTKSCCLIKHHTTIDTFNPNTIDYFQYIYRHTFVAATTRFTKTRSASGISFLIRDCNNERLVRFFLVQMWGTLYINLPYPQCSVQILNCNYKKLTFLAKGSKNYVTSSPNNKLG
jgi:hypothetical protein